MDFSLHFLTDESVFRCYQRELEKHGQWSCQHVNSCEKAGPGPDHIIYLADSDRGIAEAAGSKRPVIGISHPGNEDQSLMGCPLLVTSPEAIEADLLERIWHHHYGLPLTILETDSFIVRELASGDLSFLLSLQEENADNPDGCFFPEDCPHPKDYLDDYIRFQYSFYDWGFFAIVNKKDHLPVGMAGFSSHDSVNEEDILEVGYSLLEKWQRQGIMAEILPLLISHARRSYPDKDLVCVMRPDNTASKKLAEKTGLRIQYTT